MCRLQSLPDGFQLYAADYEYGLHNRYFGNDDNIDVDYYLLDQYDQVCNYIM